MTQAGVLGGLLLLVVCGCGSEQTEDLLSPERVAEIRSQVAERLARTKAARDLVAADHEDRRPMHQVTAANAAWLRPVMEQYGWIDAARFGSKAAAQAAALAGNTGDLQLMESALPAVERDARAGQIDIEEFAILFDRVELLRGRNQRYGTQIEINKDTGAWAVTHLVDPDGVDERRRELGLGPLRDYLAGFGREITIER